MSGVQLREAAVWVPPKRVRARPRCDAQPWAGVGTLSFYIPRYIVFTFRDEGSGP